MILAECHTQCLLYLLYAVLGICCTQYQLMIMEWGDKEVSLNFLFSGDGQVDDKKERDVRRGQKSLQETGT